MKRNRLKCTLISDTHGQHWDLKLPGGQVLIHAGDFSKMGTLTQCISFFSWMNKQEYEHKIYIAGNHDFLSQKDNELFRRWQLDEDPCSHYLQDSGVEIEGVKFWGSPWQPEFCDWAWNLPRGEALQEKWALIPDDTEVLITHSPPYGYGDLVDLPGSPNNGEMVGCRDLRQRCAWLEQHNLKLHVFGHIHSGYGVYGAQVKIVNASILNDYYKMVNKPITVEI